MSYNLISTVTVGAGGAASIDFTSIPQTYTDLLVVISGRSNDSFVFERPQVTINGVATGYSYRDLVGDGGTASSGSGTSQTSFHPNFAGAAGGTSTANTFGNATVYLPNYTGSQAKTVSMDGVGENNATASYQVIAAALSTVTAAVTSMSIKAGLGTWQQYSTASLYGIN